MVTTSPPPRRIKRMLAVCCGQALCRPGPPGLPTAAVRTQPCALAAACWQAQLQRWGLVGPRGRIGVGPNTLVKAALPLHHFTCGAAAKPLDPLACLCGVPITWCIA